MFKIYFKDKAEAGNCWVYDPGATHAVLVNFMCPRVPRYLVRHYLWLSL